MAELGFMIYTPEKENKDGTSGMASTRKEYERYLAWLAKQEGDFTAVKRVANIVYNHFDKIEGTTTAQSQRSRILTPYLLKEFDRVSDELPLFEFSSSEAETQWVRLRRLTVGPFRGFQYPETFELDRRIVLFYGPNGTGKTSLCEALEYCLLGEVEESSSKRIPGSIYLRNLHVGRFEPPMLFASDAKGVQVPVTQNADAFRFCFIEKNRIDSFSRIASKSPAQRTALIASLFGLDGFNEFVRGFNNDIDGQLQLADIKNQELTLKRATLAIDNTTVLSEATDRAVLEQEEARLAAEYEVGLTYSDLLKKLGTSDGSGRLQELERLLKEAVPAEYGITEQALLDALKLALADATRLDELNAQLQQRRNEVNFKSLFLAIQELGSVISDRCPACDTPLEGEHKVRRNPFEKASTGLDGLAELANLQEQQEIAESSAHRSSLALRKEIAKVIAFARVHMQDAITAINALDTIPEEPNGSWWELLQIPSSEAEATKWDELLIVAGFAEAQDVVIRQRNSDREVLIQERDRLNAFNLRVAALRSKQEELTKRVKDASERIARFDEDNRDLVNSVIGEKEVIAFHRRVQQAYKGFLQSIRNYLGSLPSALTADLNELTLELYNGFNRFDHEMDNLVQVKLPESDDERIMVAFKSHPDVLVDALHIMSEGHIRCLGVAILLAKNLKINCPVLIFDDAVNAIDNEHRLGIRDTLFDNPMLAEKQILVTCHGEELIKDIQVIIGSRVADKECYSYTFLPHDGDRVIRVLSASTRNYTLEAQQRLAEGRVRDAVASARRAMESINERTWAFLVRVGCGEIHLKFPRPRAPLDQNNLASQIKSALAKSAFVHERKQPLLDGYTTMLSPREWAIFNLATHEMAGIEDFDQATVHRVINNLVALDDVLSSPLTCKPSAKDRLKAFDASLNCD
jgi:DNA polymerase III delta prime subunit